jgi:hypothetical protein
MRGPNGRRIRNETRSWLEEARIASLSSAAHEQVETVGDPGLGLSADGTSAADMDYCADPQRLFIEENCGSSRHDADRARWQALWESDESISRLKVCGVLLIVLWPMMLGLAASADGVHVGRPTTMSTLST